MEIKKTGDVGSEFKTLILYGDAGRGKTTALGTLPEGELLIVDADGGLASIQKMGKNHDCIRLISPTGDETDGLAKLYEVYAYLKDRENNKHKYKYVAIDSVSEMEKYFLASLLKARKKPFLTINEYGAASQQMREVIRLFRDLTEYGMHVIFTALEVPLEVDSNDGVATTKAYPMMMPKLSPEVCGLVDMVGRVEVNKEGVRRIRFEAKDKRVVAKVRVAGVEDFESPDLSKLFAKFNVKKGEKE